MAAPKLQTYGPDNIDEILTTSLVNMVPGMRDNIFRSNPVLNWLYKGKNKISITGGPSVSHAVMYGTNSTADSYSRYETIDVTPQDGMTRTQYPLRQYAVTISIDGFSERVNSGNEELEDIMDAKKMQAEESLSLLMEQDIFAASPRTDAIDSLATLVAASGTVGDINGTTNTWWQSTSTASGSFAAQGRADLTTLWNTLSVANPVGGPEMLVSDQTSFEAYESILVPQERFTDNKMADIGIRNLMFKDTPWTWSPQATSGVIYALHSKALNFFVSKNADFLVRPFVEPTNQDARTGKILLYCALATGNRRKNGKLTGVTA